MGDTSMAVELISVHFPKAAGTSFLHSLVRAYGQDAVFLDYEDDPANPCSTYSLDPDGCRNTAREASHAPDVKVIHGHFHPSKYDFANGVSRITFLRHPVDTLISIYYYWKTCEDGHCLFNYAREHRLTLYEAARLPALKYLLSRTYFGNYDMDRFDFIGFIETYSDDLRGLARALSVSFVETKENQNVYPGYRDEIAEIRTNRSLLSDLEHVLIDDIRFYDSVRNRRATKSV
jgi:hypothetical protein